MNYFPKQEYDESYQMYKMVKREEYTVKAEEPEQQQQNFFPPQVFPYPRALPPISAMPTISAIPTMPWGAFPQRYPPFLFNFPQYSMTPFPIRKPPVKKPFKIIKEVKKPEPVLPSQSISVKVEDQIQIKVETVPKPKKKKYRTNNCKNYVGLLCAGFSRTILTAKPDSEISVCIKKSVGKIKIKFDTLSGYDDDVLIDSLTKYIYKVMCGKKVRKANRERDFKIRNTKDLQSLLNIAPKDNELLCLKKEVLREMMEFFFNSDYYNQWLSNGMMTGPNRLFFMKNKVEIQKKVLNPGFYKPRFNNNQS